MSDRQSTIHKALGLLDFFSDQQPTIGLTQFSRLSGYNKATTLRFLSALESKGFVEQDEDAKSYSLGPAFLRFAQLRESTVPFSDAVQTVLRDLSAETQETAHASIISGEALANIGTIESKQANRVIIDHGEALPLHATASGLCYLAFAAPEIVESALNRKLIAHGPATLTDPEAIGAKLAEIRKQGYARSSATYEDGVTGVAAPYFGPSGTVSGAVAVAMPTFRATKVKLRNVIDCVRAAALRLTEARGGFNSQP